MLQSVFSALPSPFKRLLRLDTITPFEKRAKLQVFNKTYMPSFTELASKKFTTMIVFSLAQKFCVSKGGMFELKKYRKPNLERFMSRRTVLPSLTILT